MPCVDPPISYSRAKQKHEKEVFPKKLNAEFRFLRSALCMFMRQFENEHGFSLKYRSLENILLDHQTLDWKKAGITAYELAQWWEEHKKNDAKRDK